MLATQEAATCPVCASSAAGDLMALVAAVAALSVRVDAMAATVEATHTLAAQGAAGAEVAHELAAELRGFRDKLAGGGGMLGRLLMGGG